MKPFSKYASLSTACALAALLLAACAKKAEETADPNGLTKVILQTDWYAQPEHGGFYQALAHGYYEEVGLDVEIMPGGPNSLPRQKVAQGVVDFALGRSDDIIISASQGIPLVIAGALMQRDPQAIMYHQESGIKSFKDLDGKTVMTTPGSAMILILEKIYDIKINAIPIDYGMNRFLADKNFIQQCFITNEPYYVKKEGANPGTLLLTDSGFSPYRVWFTSQAMIRNKPEIVKAFSEASIRGWNDYLTGDRTAANAMIAASNPKQTEEFMAFVLESLIENQLVTGDPAKGEATGRISKDRILTLIDQLESIEMLESKIAIERVFDPRLLEMNDAAETSTSIPTSTQDHDGLSITTTTDGAKETIHIDQSQLMELAVTRKAKMFETDGDAHDMQVVYLADLIETHFANTGANFWIMNCGDGYQSNFDLSVIDKAKPYFVITIDGQPLIQWLAAYGHPEWGPHMVNIEDGSALLDPAHKNPWGVNEIIATTKKVAFASLAAASQSAEAKSGMAIYANSCASCHRTGNGFLGGTLSTRTLPILAAFASSSISYFRGMLENPQKTNPTATKMPSYAHYSDDQVANLVQFLVSTTAN